MNPPTPPHIQAPYYGTIVVAEFVGTSAPRRIQELSINSPTLSGYGLYGEHGRLKKVLLINSEAFLTDQTTPRPSSTIFLDNLGGDAKGYGGPRTMTLKRLSIPHADAKTGITWGGQSYETSDALVKGKIQTTTQRVDKGVTISATEVVLVTFN